jgi:hypothetical protein
MGRWLRRVHPPRVDTSCLSEEREAIDEVQSEQVAKQRESEGLTGRERVHAVAEALSHGPRGLR